MTRMDRTSKFIVSYYTTWLELGEVNRKKNIISRKNNNVQKKGKNSAKEIKKKKQNFSKNSYL